jgi:hypothetical protein
LEAFLFGKSPRTGHNEIGNKKRFEVFLHRKGDWVFDRGFGRNDGGGYIPDYSSGKFQRKSSWIPKSVPMKPPAKHSAAWALLRPGMTR